MDVERARRLARRAARSAVGATAATEPEAPPPPPERRTRTPAPQLAALILSAVSLLVLAAGVVAVVTDVFVAPWRLLGSDVPDFCRLAGGAVGLAGGLRLARGREDGRHPALAGLALDLGGSVLGGHWLDPLTFGIGAIFAVLLVYLYRLRLPLSRPRHRRPGPGPAHPFYSAPPEQPP